MGPSEWAREQVERLARHYPVVWVEDPYRLIEANDLQDLERRLVMPGAKVIAVKNAFRLREALLQFDPDAPAVKLVLIDQSYRLRDQHSLPRDAKPADLVLLPAPDWKPMLKADAIFRPTIRDFLVQATDDNTWPSEVNIYPYENLARQNADEFIRTFETFRRTGRTLTSDDLVLVGASAIFRRDLFEINDPITALEVAFHSQDRWDAVGEFFDRGEQELIRARLRESPRPLGDLFGDNPDNARLALVALVVLRQHFPEPGRHLPMLSPALARFSDCTVPAPAELPAWFVGEEIPRFEKLIGEDFLRELHSTLRLDEEEQARKFAEEERLSPKLRALVPFQLQRETAELKRPGGDFALDRLVPEFMQLKAELNSLINSTATAVERLRLTPSKQMQAKQVTEPFVDGLFHRVDHLVGKLESLLYYIEGPARPQWPHFEGFEKLWFENARECRDLLHNAGKLRDDLDYQFGRLIESRYAEVVPTDLLPADLFYEKFMAPRRRASDGSLRKAVSRAALRQHTLRYLARIGAAGPRS